MTLGTCKPLPGIEIREFRNEEELLLAWRDLIVFELDLDLLTGHNIFKFDLNYVAKRAEILKLHDFFKLGKLSGERGRTAIKSTESQSKAFGHHRFYYLPMAGRMQMDLYQIMTKEHKLSSYKLDNMARMFLGDKKDDVSPKEIFEFQVKSSSHRAIIAKYCAQDCKLVYRIIQRLDILQQYIEMSKVTGVTMNDLNTRGQQIKVFTQIVREAHISNFVIPDAPRGRAVRNRSRSDIQYQGAFVLKPKKGSYQEPIATLDFASLYPSIIRADNLSYETLVFDPSQLGYATGVSQIKVEQVEHFDCNLCAANGSNRLLGTPKDPEYQRLVRRISSENRIAIGTNRLCDSVEGRAMRIRSVEGPVIILEDDVYESWIPEGRSLTVRRVKVLSELVYQFVQDFEGTVPRICKNLLEARANVKSEMAVTIDPVRRGLLNGKQLALKISCNSVYGFTGASRGLLPCIPIACSVTSVGQEMIKTTKMTVEEYFNASVIYGDTDSVMVNFHCGEGKYGLAKALQLGQEAARIVSSKFKPPIKLEFEKVYMPYILYSKKRYAGQMYTRADKPDRIDIKGLQVVRRDNSQLARDIMKELINAMIQEPPQRLLLALYARHSQRFCTLNTISQSDFSHKLCVMQAVTDEDIVKEKVQSRNDVIRVGFPGFQVPCFLLNLSGTYEHLIR
jgi:DNA polymerase elongation subunit (family B)